MSTFLIAGDANADASAALTRFPHEGDDSPLQDLAWTSGGSSANTAAALAKLGAGALTATRKGAAEALPSRDEVEAFLVL